MLPEIQYWKDAGASSGAVRMGKQSQDRGRPERNDEADAE